VIIVRVRGGLGNQLFQYAAGRALSVRTGRQLLLDTSWFDRVPTGSTNRRLYLFEFDIEAAAAKTRDVRLAKGKTLIQKLSRRVSGMDRRRAKVIDDASKYFAADNDSSSRLLYLSGYWQSEDYFVPIAETIRRELRIKRRIDTAASALLNETSDSVCVHVRRGDYVSNPGLTEVFARCPIEYYERAMDLMRTRLRDPRFFVFSDEPEWVSHRFPQSESVRIVDSREFADATLTDFSLMMGCRHFIVANSTFSWWAAWLGAYGRKLVVAPRMWFADQYDTAGNVVPSGWLRVENKVK
jgi:hypothetical protein